MFLKGPLVFYLFITLSFIGCSIRKYQYNNYDVNNYKIGKWIEKIDTSLIGFEIVKYKKNLKEGKAEIHFSNNETVIGEYKSNKKHGGWKFYKKGVIYKIEFYTEGFITRIEFYENGKLTKQAITDPTF